MTHPYDEAAIEAAAWDLFQRKWGGLPENIRQKLPDSFAKLETKQYWMNYAESALTAAHASMVQRGLAREAENFVVIDELAPPFKGHVTMYRRAAK